MTLMSVRVFWYSDEKRILHYEFVAHWTWQDYYDVLPQGRDLMREVGHNVCILNDMRESLYVPSNFLHRAKSVIDTRPPNTGLVVFVTTNAFLTAMYRSLIRLYPDLAEQYTLVPDFDEALACLHHWIQNDRTS